MLLTGVGGGVACTMEKPSYKIFLESGLPLVVMDQKDVLEERHFKSCLTFSKLMRILLIFSYFDQVMMF